MFKRKKKAPPPDSIAAALSQIGNVNLPPPASLGKAGFPPTPSPTSISSISQAVLQGGPISRAAMLQMLQGEEPTPPEPKEEPKTEIGLIGYRLYTLDNELYLCGAQGNRQESQESEPATHKPTGDSRYGPPHEHPAPKWACLCGFAAFFWPTALGQPGWNGVLAEVQAGGRTICCEEGWRAERIVLNKLWIACPIFPNSALEILRKRYEVPVEVL